MSMTAQQIYDYAYTLSEEALGDFASTVEWMNEAQEIIARFDPIEATPVEYTLDEDHEITLPADFMTLSKAKWGDETANLAAAETWAGVMTLPTPMTDGTLKLYYYKNPATILETGESQVPEVAPQYHRAISHYMVSKYHEVDDDQALSAKFYSNFMNLLQTMKMPVGNVTNYYNY